MTTERWIWAVVALGSGLLIGELGGRLVRAARSGRDRPPEVRARARAVGALVFWTATAIGLVTAAAILDGEEVADLASSAGEQVPLVLLAFVTLIIGYGLAVAVAAAVGQSAKRASGVRQRNLEWFLRLVIMAAAVGLALSQLGVEPGVLAALVTALVVVPLAALALLSALGGRDVASQLAAGRAVRHQLREGWWLEPDGSTGEVEGGRILALHPTAVELELADGRRRMVPNRTLLDHPFTTRP
ncbi:MAG: hypothetical protein ACOYOP_05735 [Microthrixaceae bacterium]